MTGRTEGWKFMEGAHGGGLVFSLVREDEGLEQVTDRGEGEERDRLRDVQGRTRSPR